jgi:hypothetical protein
MGGSQVFTLVALLSQANTPDPCIDELTPKQFEAAVPAFARHILLGTPQVTAVRLAEDAMHSFKPQGPVVDVPAHTARPLLALLASPTSYRSFVGLCMFSPGVEYRLQSGERLLRVQLCFECDDVLFLDGDGQAVSPVLPMCNSRAPFVKIAKRVFPKDREIRQLSEVR